MLSFVRLTSGCAGEHIFLVRFSLYYVQFCEQESVIGLSYVLVCYCLIISIIMVHCLFQGTSWLLPDHLHKCGPLSFSGYKLVAFISHMGTSTSVGHYVCHILRDGRWVIYNDEKVAQSEHPPRDLAYLYLYQRV